MAHVEIVALDTFPFLKPGAVFTWQFKGEWRPSEWLVTWSNDMAKLTAASRKALPAKDFAGPGRSYPVENRSHAAKAKARASEMEHKGAISKSEESHIDAKANSVLGRGVKHLQKHHTESRNEPKR